MRRAKYDPHSSLLRLVLRRSTIIIVMGLLWLVATELQTSELQASVLSQLARDMTFWPEPGPNPDPAVAPNGPYDDRLGYSQLAPFTKALNAIGFQVERQARLSPSLRRFMETSSFMIYPERNRAGLTIEDRYGRPLFRAQFPERVYPSFDSIPPIVVNTLLYIENRELLDPGYPNRNPAVEWDRLIVAGTRWIGQMLGSESNVPGGSPLATQIEKYRHSPQGLTRTPIEKVWQITAASLRAYQSGSDTTQTRRQIVLDYLNSTPLAGRPGFGEVIGLGDGLWAWYATDLEVATRILRGAPGPHFGQRAYARIYKQILSLLLAQRRPSYYLRQNPRELERLTNYFLGRLSAAGIIDEALRSESTGLKLDLRSDPPSPAPAPFRDQKASSSVRVHLLSSLGISSLHELDRLDLVVDTSFDRDVQRAVIAVLKRLSDPCYLRDVGLYGSGLLNEGGPNELSYSVTVYERGVSANYVRVQADNVDGPLDINNGTKLDLGSTAKLRTLISYLEIIAKLHIRFRALESARLETIARDAPDPLTRWTAQWLATSEDRGLRLALQAALERRYSASPTERFFTGGGLHIFGNFDQRDDARVLSVRDAFRRSVNLVFVRLMRDVVAYYTAAGEPRAEDILRDADHPARQVYLRRFADREGAQFLMQFYTIYHGLPREEMLARLADRAQRSTMALSIAFDSVRPSATAQELDEYLLARLPQERPVSEDDSRGRRGSISPDMSLSDRAHLARVHPLELWLVGFLQRDPLASPADVLAASLEARQEAYGWLFKTDRKGAQDVRIRMVFEFDAFQRLHEQWQRLGYPFESLVPSYATALGSSADRPASLAELIGTILNGGTRLPVVRIQRLHFAEATPYEVVLRRSEEAGTRVMAPEVAAILREALIEVVRDGTGRRARDAFSDGAYAHIVLGGKTGTGDRRYERYGHEGRLIDSQARSRSATFVFFIGDRLFGTITAHVNGPAAANYTFTSALATRLFDILAPELEPLIERPRERDMASAAR